MTTNKETGTDPRAVAQQLLERVGAFWGATEDASKNEAIVDLFADEIDFWVAGEKALLPWAGARRAREEVRTFYPELALHVRPRRYQVNRILSDDEVAVIVGELESELKATGKVAKSPFAIEIGVRNGKIIRFQVLEDTQAVERAAT